MWHPLSLAGRSCQVVAFYAGTCCHPLGGCRSAVCNERCAAIGGCLADCAEGCGWEPRCCGHIGRGLTPQSEHSQDCAREVGCTEPVSCTEQVGCMMLLVGCTFQLDCTVQKDCSVQVACTLQVNCILHV